VLIISTLNLNLTSSLNTTIQPVLHVNTQCNVLSATDVTEDVTSFLYYPA